MTPSELKFEIESRHPAYLYFSRDTMRFWGDTMKNYGVRQVIVKAQFDVNGEYHEQGVDREAFELYRKKPVKHGNKKSAYFDRTTFKCIHSMVE